MFIRNFKFFCAAALFTVSGIAQAWDGAPYGTITRLEATPDAQMSMRVYLNGNPVACSAGQQWAYVDAIDPGAKSIMSVILLAKAQNKNIQLFTTNVNIAGGTYCHIGYIQILN